MTSYPGDFKKYEKDGLSEEQFVKINWGFNPNTMMYNEKKTTDIFLSHGGGLHADRVDKINQFKTNNYGIRINYYTSNIWCNFRSILFILLYQKQRASCAYIKRSRCQYFYVG